MCCVQLAWSLLHCFGYLAAGLFVLLGLIWLIIAGSLVCEHLYYLQFVNYMWSVLVISSAVNFFTIFSKYIFLPFGFVVCDMPIYIMGGYYFQKCKAGKMPSYNEDKRKMCGILGVVSIQRGNVRSVFPIDIEQNCAYKPDPPMSRDVIGGGGEEGGEEGGGRGEKVGGRGCGGRGGAEVVAQEQSAVALGIVTGVVSATVVVVAPSID